VSKAWVDQMSWIEVNNQPQLLEEYKDFFAAPNYEKVQEQVQKAFRAAF
jgi:hypothetical protein